jgi:predicted tellurium resistance membrane protein TerC
VLTLKRILIAFVLWVGADLIAMPILTTTHVISVEGHPSRFSGGTQFLLWVAVSICLGIACFKLSWAKIR